MYTVKYLSLKKANLKFYVFKYSMLSFFIDSDIFQGNESKLDRFCDTASFKNLNLRLYFHLVSTDFLFAGIC